MDDERTTKNLEKDLSGQPISTISNDSTIFQPIRVRRSTVWSDIVDRKFMEGELRFVLYCGTFFWVVYLLSQII